VLDLHRLRLLRELSRRGTITAVAQALSFSPSAISQQLATLERETGVRLLEPAGRRVRLTAQADLLVEHAAVLLENMEKAESALARSLGETTGTVRIAAFQTAVLTLIPPALNRLQSAHPALRVEVTELEPDVALPAMVAGDYDLVLAEEYPGHPLPHLPDADRVDLLTDELFLVTPSGWPERCLRELSERPFVMEPAGTPAGLWAMGACRQAGFEPDVRYLSTDLQIHLRLVEEQLAVALLPELSGARSRGSATTVHPLEGRPARQLFTAVRRGARNHPAIQAVTEAIAFTPRAAYTTIPSAGPHPAAPHQMS
jgi:DNA-binding transcriptional LysR family regulator